MTATIAHTALAVFHARLREDITAAASDGVKQFARRIGVSHRTVQDWTQGRRSPGARELLAMAADNDRIAASIMATIQEARACAHSSSSLGSAASEPRAIPSLTSGSVS